MEDSQTELKHLLSGKTVDELCRVMTAESKHFDGALFTRTAKRGLGKLELKARVIQIAAALDRALPGEYPEAAGIVLRAVKRLPPLAETTTVSFRCWPLCEYAGLYGRGHRVDAFAAMKELTAHFSCEFAIRPYLEESPDWAIRQLKTWVRDKDPHVRRLVSEGTRPRLPWASRLKTFQQDPTLGIALLDRLYFDKDLYVRRSVANHLNDIAKDHPDLAVSTAEGWLSRRDTEPVRWVVRHALRSLVKDGNVGALRLLGYGAPRLKDVKLKLSPKRLSFGDPLSLEVSFVSTTRQSLMVDFALHRRLANGSLAAKVFKLKIVELQAGESWRANKRLPIRPISTRRYYDGEHRIELIVNGKSVATESFRLTGAEKARG